MRKKVIFVLGMGRSGTSALTRVLSLAGCALPERLLEPSSGNVTGHWEPRDALEINERYLRLRDSSWYDSTLKIRQDYTSIPNEQATLIAEAADFLSQLARRDAAHVFVIKEPRISALFGAWRTASDLAGLDIKIVFCFRHPGEVIRSLEKRDSLSHAHSGLLWLKYNLLAEQDTRDLDRIFVSYAELLSNWRLVMNQISLTVQEDLRADSSEVESFLNMELRHHVEPDIISIPPKPKAWIFQLYDALESKNSERISAVSSSIYESFSDFESFFRAGRSN